MPHFPLCPTLPYGFDQIPKFWKLSLIFGRFLAKNRIFFNFRGYVLKKIFSGKCIQSQGNGPICLKIGIHVPQYLYQTFKRAFLEFLCFCHFRGPEIRKKVFFWSKTLKIDPKQYFLRISGPVKWQKHKNSKKALLYLQYGYQGTCIPNFRPIGLFPQDQQYFPAKFVFQNVPAKIEKSTVFRPKTAKNRQNFPKFWDLIKNHLNALYVKILGHLDHFLAKYGNFWPFFAHFGPIIL